MIRAHSLDGNVRLCINFEMIDSFQDSDFSPLMQSPPYCLEKNGMSHWPLSRLRESNWVVLFDLRFESQVLTCFSIQYVTEPLRQLLNALLLLQCFRTKPDQLPLRLPTASLLPAYCSVAHWLGDR